MNFVHLHTRSDYSILLSTITPKALVDRAFEYDMGAIAFTDLNNLYGAVEFFSYAKSIPPLKDGRLFNPIIGIEINTKINLNNQGTKNLQKQNPYSLVLLAENLEGYKNLSRLSSMSFEQDTENPYVLLEHLQAFAKGCIALSSGNQGQLFSLARGEEKESALQLVDLLKNIYGENNFFLEIQNHNYEEEKKANQFIIDLSYQTSSSLVATNQVCYLNKNDWISWDILCSIGEKNLIEIENNQIKQNRSIYLPGEGHHFKSKEEMELQFSNFPQALENTTKIAERCRVDILDNEKHMPALELDVDAKVYLRRETINKLKSKKLDSKKGYMERLEYELSIVEKMDYSSYFILVADFINYARENNIMVGAGRGSAAGSLISYVMGITALDPIAYGLYFERFLNPERISFPDIDIDFQDDGRDKVIKYVRNRYGGKQVAQIITFGKLKSKAVFKDVSRVFGIEFSTANKISGLIRIPSGEEEAEKKQGLSLLEFNYEYNLEFASVINSTPIFKLVYDHALKLEGLTRQTGIHPAGVVVADKPLSEYAPLAKSHDNVWITQYDGSLLESYCGLLKIDFLGIKTLTVLQKCVDDIKRVENKTIDIMEPPLDDQKTFTMFSQGLTAGIFQFESDGMTRYLKDLMPSDLKELTAMNALYRPGPMAWIPVYIAKKHNCDPQFDNDENRQNFYYLEKICSQHKELNQILQETRGIPFYQEQIMEICKVYAGFTLGGADSVRKAMGKKDKNLIQEIRSDFIKKSIALNNSQEDSEFLYDKIIVPFAGYGFNKSHATCYAYLAYQTAYLKANHPISFMTALLNSELESNNQKFSNYINECFLMKIDVFPPDINYSSILFSSSKKNIIFGLAGIKNIGVNVAKEIILERETNGAYKDLIDFLLRHPTEKVSKLSLDALVKAGCFDYTGIKSDQWLLVLEEILKRLEQQRDQRNLGQLSLFEQADLDINKDIYKKVKNHVSLNEKVSDLEKESLGFNLRYEPLLIYQEQLAEATTLDTNSLSSTKNRSGHLGCVIRKVLFLNDKRNKKMAKFDVSDGKNSLSVICFSTSWEKIKKTLPPPVDTYDDQTLTQWLKSKPVVMKINIFLSKSSFNSRDMFLESLSFLTDNFVSNVSKTIWIQLVRDKNYQEEELNNLNHIFQANPGKDQVKIVIIEGAEKVVYPVDMKVKIAFAMRMALNNLKIVENIKITESVESD